MNFKTYIDDIKGTSSTNIRLDDSDSEKSSEKSEKSEKSSDNMKIDISMSDSDSVDNANRPEMPWTKKTEDLLNLWETDIKRSHKMHDKSGYHYKHLRKVWGIPAIILPGVMSPISAVFAETTWIKYVNMGAFVLVAIFAGIDAFFSFATRKEQHFNHSSRYDELTTIIEGELYKSKQFRTQADVFLTSVRLKYNHLNSTAPIVPDNILRSFERNEKFTEVVAIVNDV